MSRVAYIRAWPRDPVTGAPGLVAMAGGGSHLPYFLDNLHYRAGVVREPRFAAALGFDEKGWTGAALPSVSVIEFAPGDTNLLRAYAAFYWKDAAIEVDAGDEYAGVGRILTGTVADAVVQGNRLQITVADFGVKLNKPAIQSWFAGTGGIEGDATAEGRVKRRSYGYCANVEGRVLLAAWNIYEFGDPSRGFQSFPIVRDMGREGPVQVLGWQGSINATLEALKAATPPQGGATVAPSIACVKWWTQPAGPLTADIEGENAGGYVETPVQIAARLLAAAGGPEIVNQAEAVALRNLVAGLHIGDDGETTAAALDRLLLPVSRLWRFGTTGLIDVRPWSWDGDAEIVQGRFIGRTKTLAPMKTRRLGYNRNHRQHSEGEIAADILAAGIAYADGTTLEQLKPAEGGANVTGNHTSAAFVGQGALATRNDVLYGSHITSLPAAIDPTNLINGQYLSAGFGRYLDGVTMQALRPGEAGANITESRVASAIAGQGQLATQSSLAFGSSFLTGFGSLAGLGNLFFGSPFLLESSGGVAASLSAFKTALGVASGFSGQGALATMSSLFFGSPLLTGFGGLAGRDTVRLGVGGGMVNEAQNLWLTDSGVITGLGTAAAIAGQSAWATFGVTTGVVSRLQNDGYMQANSIYLPNVNFLHNVFPGEYGANVTEGRTAAAFSGQGALATRNAISWTDALFTGRPTNLASLSGGEQLDNARIFGSGVNRISFSRMEAGTVGWAVMYMSGLSLSGALGTADVNGRRYVKQSFSSTGSGQVISLGNGNRRFPVSAGERLSVQIGVEGQGPVAQQYAVLRFRNSAGSIIDPQGITNSLAGPQAFGSHLKTFAIVPAGATNAEIELYLETNGSGAGSILITEPMVAGATLDQSVFPPFNPGPNAYDAADVTSNNTAAAIQGQSAWATFGVTTGVVSRLQNDGYMQANSIYLPNVNFLHNVFPGEFGANVTEGRTAAAFSGQGTLATRNSADMADGSITNRYAEYLVYGYNGIAVSDLRPEEAGGNRTEIRTAAALQGQGALATRSNIGWDDSLLTGRPGWTYGTMGGGLSGKLDSAQIGYGGDTSVLSNRWPEEGGSNRTEGRTAAAFNGQGALATRNSADMADGSITNRYAEYLTYGYNGIAVSDLRPDEAGSNKTESRTAAAINGQGTFATQSWINSGNVASFFSYSAFRLEYNITRFDGTTIVTENMVITSVGVAAGFVGQGVGATANNLAQLDPQAQTDLNNVKGGRSVTYGYFDIKKIILEPGASINVSGAVGVNAGGTSNGNVRAQLTAGPAGSPRTVFANGSQESVTSSEPAISYVDGIFVNNTGVRQLFEIAITLSRTPSSAGGSVNSAQSYYS